LKLIEKLTENLKNFKKTVFSPATWHTFGDYVGLGKKGKEEPINDLDSLKNFLQTRSSHVAQTALYGYLRTRAGTRYPELFENPGILISINIAKWQIWLACLSDLTIYVGGLICQSRQNGEREVRGMLMSIVNRILEETGIPEEAGDRFPASAEVVRERIENHDWADFEDNERVFTESPAALVYWAPIADTLKRRDDEIVRNSVRFRWQEIRRAVRRLLQIPFPEKHLQSSMSDVAG